MQTRAISSVSGLEWSEDVRVRAKPRTQGRAQLRWRSMAPSSPLPYCPAVWWVGYGASLSACADAVLPDRPSLDAAPWPPPRSHPGQSDYWGRVSFPDKKSAPGAGCGEPGGQREVIGRGTNAEWGAEKNPPNLRFQKHSPPAAEGTRWGHGALGSEPWGSLCLGFAPRQGLQGAPNPAAPPPVCDAAAWISHSGGPACSGLGDGDSSPGLPWTLG